METTLISQYQTQKQRLEKTLDRLLGIPEEYRTPSDNSDIHNIRLMISNITFSIRSIECGRYPDPIHPVTRWATEKREIRIEPQVMDRIFGEYDTIPPEEPEPDPYFADQEFHNDIVNRFLSLLSKREREVFLLIKDRNYSYRDAARLLGIGHGRVNNIMYRIRHKFDKEKQKPQH